jgi:DNA-binding MarR family transcriptional regulator
VDLEMATSLRIAVQRLSRQLNSSATAEGLTPTQASVLALVANRSPVSPAEIGRAEGINPTMVSRIVSRLDELGLVRRVSNPRDLRGVIIEITPSGLETQARIKAQRARVVADALGRISEAERQAVRDAIPAINALVDVLRG